MFSTDTTPSASFPYQIETQVGSGSMGVVFRATEVGLDRPVAIKALKASLLEDESDAVQREMRDRFQREARAAAALSHPGVTTIYRVGEEEGTPFIAMEWLEGATLEEMLRARGKLPLGEAARLAVELLDALAAAHRKGVVHRDVKPSNLMLLEEGRLKVTDFGIARLEGSDLAKTQAGVVLATPRFASPEQLVGGGVDGRSDLFSTGILLYLMLTGKLPFGGKTFMELATSILQKQPPALRKIDTSLPAAVESLVIRALEKDPAQRFQSAEEMADQLRSFTEGLPAAEGARGAAVSGRGGDTAASGMPLNHHGLPRDPRLAVLRFIESWPSRELAPQPTPKLLGRLLEKPLHAPAFSGAAVIDRVCLLLYEGRILAAADAGSAESGDRVAESLPAESGAKLYPLPAPLPATAMPLLATLFEPPKVRHGDLHSSFVNLPALAKKLEEESFEGLMRLQLEGSLGLIFFDRGRVILSLFSEGWEQVPIDESWQTWVSDVNVEASVEERSFRPVALWYRRALRDFELEVEPAEGDDPETMTRTGTGSQIRQLLSGSKGTQTSVTPVVLKISRPLDELGVGGAGPSGMSYLLDPAYRFLDWAIHELPGYLAERDKLSAWKYLGEWIYLVRKAKLHHDLPRPKGGAKDFFDVATFDGEGKVLHLGQRVAVATPKCLEEFVERATAAKMARKKTGDVGGAFLVAPSFEEATAEAYEKLLAGGSGSWFSLEESFTGYEGFLRVGPRRGFHLLMVEEREDGFFPLLPA